MKQKAMTYNVLQYKNDKEMELREQKITGRVPGNYLLSECSYFLRTSISTVVPGSLVLKLLS